MRIWFSALNALHIANCNMIALLCQWLYSEAGDHHHAVHAYKTTEVTCHIKPPTPILTPLFRPSWPSWHPPHPKLIPGSDGGVEGGTGGRVTGAEGVMEVNSLSLFTGCKGSRQSVSALMPGQSYMSLCVKAQRWQTAGWKGAQRSFQSQAGRN